MVILYFEDNGLSFDMNDIDFYETTSWPGEKSPPLPVHDYLAQCFWSLYIE